MSKGYELASPFERRPIGTAITCLACGGKGYITARDYRGFPYPMRCGACSGSGSQHIRS